jgi:hypothetical protein
MSALRAQRSLHISWCKRRKRAGTTINCDPSRFIKEMRLNEGDAVPKESEVLSPQQRLANLKAAGSNPVLKERKTDVSRLANHPPQLCFTDVFMAQRSAVPDTPAKGVLYKAQSGDKTLYLFGSVHLARESFTLCRTVLNRLTALPIPSL